MNTKTVFSSKKVTVKLSPATAIAVKAWQPCLQWLSPCFDLFPGIYQVHAIWITGTQHAGKTLDAENRIILIK